MWLTGGIFLRHFKRMAYCIIDGFTILLLPLLPTARPPLTTSFLHAVKARKFKHKAHKEWGDFNGATSTSLGILSR